MSRPLGRAEPADSLGRGELWVLAGGLFAMVAVMAVRVQGTSWPLRIDELASGVVESVRAPTAIALWIGTVDTNLLVNPFVGWGTLWLAGALVVVMAAVAWRRRDRWGALLCLVAPPLAVAVTDLLAKPLVGRYHGHGLAFPSGHATAATAAAALVLVLINRWRGWHRALHWSPFAALLPLVTAIGLVRLDWHYPTDVVGGIAMGAAVVVALAAVAPPPTPHPPLPREE